jgi:hypothetical protein
MIPYMFRASHDHLQEDIVYFAVSGILTLCMLPYIDPIKSGLQYALNRCNVWQHTELEDTRYCKYTMSS